MHDHPSLPSPKGCGVTFAGALLVAGLVAGGVAAPAMAQGPTGTGATDGGVGPNATVDYAGNGVVEHAGEVFLWRDEPVTVTATVNGSTPSRLCLVLVPPAAGPTTVECAPLGVDGTTTFRFSVAEDLDGRTGNYRVELRSDGEGSGKRTYDASAVTVISKQGDRDHDRLSNAREVNGSTDFTDPDSDDDGLRDGSEVLEYNTSPTAADTDDDGRRDGLEVLVGTDPNVRDAEPGIEASAVPSDRTAPPNGTLVDWLGGHLGSVGAEVFGLVGLVVLGGIVYQAVQRSRDGRVRSRTDGTDRGDRPDRNGNGPATGWDGAATDGRPTGSLTDEEYVLMKLQTHDGRMKQSELVEATGWSKAKVSRVLSRAEAAGLIRKNHVGRENVIVLDAEA